MKLAAPALNIPTKYTSRFAFVRRYRILGFIVLVALLYGFLLVQIGALSTAEPQDDVVSEQVKAAKVPHIDPEIVQQLESLEDNSVSVQSLFNEARSNPFE